MGRTDDEASTFGGGLKVRWLGRWRLSQPPQEVLPEQGGLLIGTDCGFRAVIWPSGSVQLANESFCVSWWVRVGDRWYNPSTDAAIQQSRFVSAPVADTALTVPSGRIVSRSWAGLDNRPGVVTEIHNQTSSPVAVAVVIQGVHHVEARSRTLLVDGNLVCVLDRQPSLRFAAAHHEDLWTVVTKDESSYGRIQSAEDTVSGSAVACIIPLPHRQYLRFVSPNGEPASFPSAEQITNGWTARLEETARIELPDRALVDSVSTGLVDFLLAEPTPDISVQLAAWGLYRQAIERIITHCRQDPVAWLRAAAITWSLCRQPNLFSQFPIEGLIASGKVSELEPGTIGLLSGLFSARGDHRAAEDAKLLTGRAAEPNGHLWDLARRLACSNRNGLTLLSGFPEAWHGKPIEVHNLPTTRGVISYGIRWHGDRPALLWELKQHGDEPVILTVPDLDPGFTTSNPRGETLLESALTAAGF